MNEELLDNLKRSADAISSLKKAILTMCDDMDATTDFMEKEKIKLAIIDTESLLDSAIDTYNELVEQTNGK